MERYAVARVKIRAFLAKKAKGLKKLGTLSAIIKPKPATIDHGVGLARTRGETLFVCDGADGGGALLDDTDLAGELIGED